MAQGTAGDLEKVITNRYIFSPFFKSKLFFKLCLTSLLHALGNESLLHFKDTCTRACTWMKNRGTQMRNRVNNILDIHGASVEACWWDPTFWKERETCSKGLLGSGIFMGAAL